MPTRGGHHQRSKKRLAWCRHRVRSCLLVAPRRLLLTAVTLLFLAFTPLWYLGLGTTHPVIGWNLYVIGDIVNMNRVDTLARWAGACVPPVSSLRAMKAHCEAVTVPGNTFHRIGWGFVQGVNEFCFTGTIAWEYLRKARKGYDVELLCDVLVRNRAEKYPALLPPHDAIVVHLRLGDDIEVQYRHTELWDGEDHRKVKNKEYFEMAIAEFPPEVKSVIITGSSVHKGYLSSNQGSVWYRNKVIDLFKSSGYTVHERWDNLPDDDFVYLASARYFLPTGGGYGGLASACVDRAKGTSIRVRGGAGQG